MRRRDLLGCCLAPLTSCTPARNPWSDLETAIPQLMEQTKVPGLSLAVIQNARLAWRRAFGVKDRASGAPADLDTMFEAASMSKPVFAYAVMKLCEKGILSLDTPLTQYTSGRFVEGDTRLDLITPRRVLSHTTGLPNWRTPKEPLKINFQPGTKWSYSGEGYYYLQSVMTSLTGHADPKSCGRYEEGVEVCATDFDSYMKTNLLAPFAMTSSGYVWTDAFARQMARPHGPGGEPQDNKKSAATDVARYGSAGALLTTATDYAKFLIEVMGPKPADAFRLNQASLREMLRPQIKIEDAGGYSISWALGWRVAQTPRIDLIGHGGDNTGFHSTSEISLKDKSGYVILTNGEGGVELLQKLAPDLSRRLHSPVAVG